MCGIIAYLGDSAAVAILVEGLKRMEYRGYDSSGVAIVESKEGGGAVLSVEKRKGKVSVLSQACAGRDFKGTLGIGHTRWATHGAPSDVNSHPHRSGVLAIVHNGIIENYSSLKKRLKAEGYEFASDTDSEVLAHLIHHVQTLDPSMELHSAVSLALSQVRGAYGIAVVDQRFPDLLVGARRGSPLIIGVGKSGLLLASDATAVIGHTDKVIYLEDEDLVLCRREGGEYTFNVMSMAAPALDEAATTRPSAGSVTAGSESDAGGNVASPSADHVSRLDRSIQRSRMQSAAAISHNVERGLHELTMSLDKIEKAGYEHFMLKEILEQPRVLRDCMRGRINPDTGEVKLGGLEPFMERILASRRIIICACGTSWHSALVGEYLIEKLARIPVEVEYASEFRYRSPVIDASDVVIVISQSGETADTLEAVKIAKEHGALAIGLVNVVGSSIARATDCGAYLHVGPEIGVASTKAFTGQVMTLCMLALHLAKSKATMNAEQLSDAAQAMGDIPRLIEGMITPEKLEIYESMAKQYRYCPNFLYLGRGFQFPVALEGALKLKEISYIHAEGYPAAEMKHGPIALIDRLMPVVIIAPRNDAIYEKVKSGIEEVVARQGAVIAITEESNRELDDLAEFVIGVPPTLEWLSPMLTTVPLQLISYYIAKMRGCAIDQPRNLAKSVTVE